MDWAIVAASPAEIGQMNILNASHLATHQAIKKLVIKPKLLLIDGSQFLAYPSIKHACIVKGD